MKYLVTFTLIFFVGCASTSNRADTPFVIEKPNPSSAIIYIYRPWGLYAGGVSIRFNINENHVIDLKNNRYTKVSISPGTYDLSVLTNSALRFNKEPEHSETFSIKAGQIKFFKWHAKTSLLNIYSTGFTMAFQNNEQAVNDLQGLKYQAPRIGVIECN